MKNYIDVKMTVWQRLHFAEGAYMKGIADIIREEGLEEVLDDKIGFLQSETLFDTEARLNPSDNDGEATIEVYADSHEIWNNKVG